MTQFTEFPVYGSQDGVLERVAGHLADSDVVSVSYTVGANADTPVKGASATHKVCVYVCVMTWYLSLTLLFHPSPRLAGAQSGLERAGACPVPL